MGLYPAGTRITRKCRLHKLKAPQQKQRDQRKAKLAGSLRQTKKEASHYPNGAVIIPAFNEADTIGSVIRSVHRHINLPVWVIDDGSTDATRERALTAGARVLSLPFQMGAWGATQTGLRYAHELQLEFVVTMDADGQHDAASAQDLLNAVVSGEADVSLGTFEARGSNMRRAAWKLMRLASGLDFRDPTSGYRAMNAKAVKALIGPAASILDHQDIGVLILLVRAELRIREVPVNMFPRRNGQSRIFSTWRLVFAYMIQTLSLALAKRPLRHNQRSK